MRPLQLIVFLLFLGAPSAGEGALRTFYVDPAGNDLAAGGDTTPWRTLQHAANVVQAGDLVIVRAGQYAGFDILYSNHAGGITLYQIDGGDVSKNNVVVHNTIVQASDGRWAINITGGATGNTVQNNILYNFHSFRGSITISPDSLAGFVSDWNVVMDRFSVDDGETRITLAQWRAATGLDLHSLIAVPTDLFVNAAAADYRLKATSPARDAGVTLAEVTVDITGAPRPVGATSDIGAYEYGPGMALSVLRRGSAAGAVTSQPTGIDCGATCGASFTSGSGVALTAAPPPGTTFAHWSGACTGANPVCTVTMGGPQTVTATFAQVFTDSPLAAGLTPVRAAHVTELRAAIQALRMWRGLPALTWTDPALVAGVTIVRAAHLIELRTALDAVFVADSLAPPVWSTPPVAWVTSITAAQTEEIRTQIRIVE